MEVDEPPPALRRGIEQFSAGEYWECHETLEHLWNAEPRAVRDLYQGSRRSAWRCHLRQGNYAGAIKMFAGVCPPEGPAPVCQSVPVHEFAAAARPSTTPRSNSADWLDRLDLPFPQISPRELPDAPNGANYRGSFAAEGNKTAPL